MSSLQLKTIQTQCVIFFEKAKNIDFEELSVTIKREINIEFISPSNYTNLPDFAPAEIPRLEMTSVDKSLLIAASNSNIVMTHKEMKGTPEISELALSKIKTIAEIIAKKAKIVRFGYVVTQTIDNSNPAEFISTNLFGRKIDNASEYTCRIVLKSDFRGVKYNNAFFFEPGEKSENNVTTPIVLLTRDINLTANSGASFTPIFLENFVSETSSELLPERLSAVFIKE